MRLRLRTVVLTTCLLALAGCGDGLVRRVSEPTARIQQLTVAADGSWQVDLRLQNYSSIPMRFDTVALKIQLGEHTAGTLEASPALSIGPESADVVTLPLQPAAEARMIVADALAARRPLGYQLSGTVAATPEDAKQRNFTVDSRSSLNQAPGLPGVLR